MGAGPHPGFYPEGLLLGPGKSSGLGSSSWVHSLAPPLPLCVTLGRSAGLPERLFFHLCVRMTDDSAVRLQLTLLRLSPFAVNDTANCDRLGLPSVLCL